MNNRQDFERIEELAIESGLRIQPSNYHLLLCRSPRPRYLPDFIVLVDDWHGAGDPLHLVAEIKGDLRGDAAGVGNLGTLVVSQFDF